MAVGTTTTTTTSTPLCLCQHSHPSPKLPCSNPHCYCETFRKDTLVHVPIHLATLRDLCERCGGPRSIAGKLCKGCFTRGGSGGEALVRVDYTPRHREKGGEAAKAQAAKAKGVRRLREWEPKLDVEWRMRERWE